jgi:hypothetical protein
LAAAETAAGRRSKGPPARVSNAAGFAVAGFAWGAHGNAITEASASLSTRPGLTGLLFQRKGSCTTKKAYSLRRLFKKSVITWG